MTSVIRLVDNSERHLGRWKEKKKNQNRRGRAVAARGCKRVKKFFEFFFFSYSLYTIIVTRRLFFYFCTFSYIIIYNGTLLLRYIITCARVKNTYPVCRHPAHVPAYGVDCYQPGGEGAEEPIKAQTFVRLKKPPAPPPLGYAPNASPRSLVSFFFFF